MEMPEKVFGVDATKVIVGLGIFFLMFTLPMLFSNGLFNFRLNEPFAVVSRTEAAAGDNVSGYAWSENTGWLSFNCTDTSSCGSSNYGVNVDSVSGNLSGHAWSEHIGWISFDAEDVAGCPGGTCQPRLSGGSLFGWARALIGLPFGVNGVITGVAPSEEVYSAALDAAGDYLYTIGLDASNNWRIEKRQGTSGQLDSGFGTNGVVTSILTDEPGGIDELALDSTYLYVVGNDASRDLRIEKRRLSDGALCTAANCGTQFGVNGVVTAASVTDSAGGIVIDSTYMYVVGEETNFYSGPWRIEKRRLSDGALCTAANCGTQFGTNGVITGAGTSRGARDVIHDGTYLYISGGDSSGSVRIEKRRMSDGALCSAANCGTQFGTNGVVLGSTGALDSHNGRALVRDSTYLYVLRNGAPSIGWFGVEKRRLDTGALETAFGGGTGYVQEDWNGSPDDMAIDSTGIYVSGDLDDHAISIVQKRDLSTGALDPSFGTGGSVMTAGPLITDYNSVLVRDDKLYLSGMYGSDWRIEKRYASDGSLVDGAGGWDGFISLNCANNGGCGTSNYAVTLSGSNFQGYAWGSDVLGWLSFRCTSCGAGNHVVILGATTLPTIDSFTANPPSPIVSGGTTELSWTTTNATACTASAGSAGWAGARPTNGSWLSGALVADTSYTLACQNGVGWATSTLNILIAATPDFSLTASNSIKKTAIQLSSSSTTIRVVPQNGFNSDINLTASPATLGGVQVNYMFSDNALASGEYSRGSGFYVHSTSTIPQGNYNITITGTEQGGSGLVRNINLSLTTSATSTKFEEF
jgi:hypothetical protein